MTATIRTDLPAADYHALPRLSSTMLRKASSRWEYEQALANPVTPTPAMNLGTAVHARLLGTWDEEIALMPEGIIDTANDDNGTTFQKLKAFAVANGIAKRRGMQEQVAAIRAERPDVLFSHEWTPDEGRLALTDAEIANVDRICEAVYANPYARLAIENSQAEVSALWTETVDGVDIESKARVDLLHPATMADVKLLTRADVFFNPEAWVKHVCNAGWHRQLEWYMRGVGRREHVAIIAVYAGDPAICEVSRVAPHFIDIARHENDKALRRIASWRRNSEGWAGPSADENGQPTMTLLEPLPWMWPADYEDAA